MAWDIDSLKEYLDKRIDDMCENSEKSVRDAKETADKAIELNTKSLEKRLDSMNEFREHLRDQDATFITRNEYTVQHKLLTDKIDQLNIFAGIAQEKASQSSVNVGYVISAIILVVTVILHFIK